MQGDAPRSPFTGVPGWLTEAEESLLMRYAAQLERGQRIVNIGVEYGRSIAAFVRASRKNRAIITGVELILKPEYALNIKEANIPYEDAFIWVGDSKQVGKEWDRGAIDFLFIDGDHSYEGCLGDIQSWAVHVKPGGFMAFHDVAQLTNKQPHYLHHEVARAIDEWFSSAKAGWSLVETVDTIAVYKRSEDYFPDGKSTQWDGSYTSNVVEEKRKNKTLELEDGTVVEVVEPPPVEKAKRKTARGRK